MSEENQLKNLFKVFLFKVLKKVKNNYYGKYYKKSTRYFNKTEYSRS